MNASVLWGVIGAIAGAAIGAGATVFTSVLSEKYRRRAELEKRKQDMELARQARWWDKQASDAEVAYSERMRWVSWAAEVRQVTSAALQELIHNIGKLDHLDTALQWPYLKDLADVTHRSLASLYVTGPDAQEVIQALWMFSGMMRMCMKKISGMCNAEEFNEVSVRDYRSELTRNLEEARAARTDLIVLLFDRVSEHGFTLPGKPDDW